MIHQSVRVSGVTDSVTITSAYSSVLTLTTYVEHVKFYHTYPSPLVVTVGAGSTGPSLVIPANTDIELRDAHLSKDSLMYVKADTAGASLATGVLYATLYGR